MFRYPVPERVPRAKPPVGKLEHMTVPFKGLNAKSAFEVMEPGFAISAVNVFCEQGGLRSRKGYTEYAKDIPGTGAIGSLLSYTPAVITNRKLFAAKGGSLYSVLNGGVGPWTAESGVIGSTDLWTGIMVQNIGGSFLCATNDAGGYSFYNGTSWATPIAGAGAGEIDGVNPNTFVFVMEFKERLWFVEKDSTSAWYLDINAVTGAVSEFDFGQQFNHGGHLVALANWSVDGGEGLDDYLVAVSSEGDVVIYQGTDPDDATTFAKKGVWYVGPLPVGRRSVYTTSGDVLILSQTGLVPLTKLLESSGAFTLEAKTHISFYIDPLVTELLRQYGTVSGWQLLECPKEELFMVGIPPVLWDTRGSFFAYKITQKTWSTLRSLPFTSLTTVGAEAYAGTADGRVVKAFTGPLDDVLIGEPSGTPVVCQITPAYESLGNKGTQKVFHLFNPRFLATSAPEVKLTVLTNFGVPSPPNIARFPSIDGPIWDVSKWNVAKWAGKQFPFSKWFGISGVGFAATIQIDYACGGDTLFMAGEYWVQEGGIL